jgi:conjugal transfer ATP-binding protein TraC
MPSGAPQTQASPRGPTVLQVLIAAMDDLLGINVKAQKVLTKAASGEELDPDEHVVISYYEEGLQKTLDLIAPSAMEVKNNEIMLNDQHVHTLFVYNWPNYIFPNWLSQIVNFDAQMDIAQYIYPASSKIIMKMLRKKVAEMRSSIRMLEQRGIVRDPTIEAALQDAEELRDLLARGREKLFQFGMYISIYAEDSEKLKKLQTDIEAILGGRLVLTKPAWFQMEHAWISSLPMCLDQLEINRNMNTSPLATSFPFSSADLTDDHGILYGINRHNDSLVIFDRFDLPNANATVFATSGAGKSFAVKLEILRSLMFGTEVFVVDPENEYVELAKTVGGTFIPVSLQSSNRINPFDLPKAIRGEEAQTGETLRAASITLHGLFKLMLGTLTPAEDGILDKAILDTYALKGITLQTEDPSGIEPPTMHELVDVLMTTQGGESMAQTLQKFTDGSYAGLFNKQTNVQLENQMVVFQIRDLEDQLRPIAMYVILNFLWNRIRAELKRRFMVIDEAWNLLQHDDSARFLYGLIKRARKYYLGVTTITQDVEDFVNSPYGKPIITNAALQILLKQSAAAVDNLQKLFYLTDGEKYLLLNSDVGQGLFFAGNKHVAIQIVASPEEQRIITTKPEEVLALRAAEHALSKPKENAVKPSPEQQERKALFEGFEEKSLAEDLSPAAEPLPEEPSEPSSSGESPVPPPSTGSRA